MVWAGRGRCRHARGGRGTVGAGEEDKVARLSLAGRHLLAEGPLGLAGAGDDDPGRAVGHCGQAGAVIGVRPGRAALVGLAELGFGPGGVGYARVSSSTGMVRTPAVWRAYSAKPG